MKKSTKTIILILWAIAAGAAIVTFVPCMSPAPVEEVVPAMARQQLYQFRICYNLFTAEHDHTSPASVNELLSDGKYLKGLREPHRSWVIAQLDYPFTNAPPASVTSIPLAAYHVEKFGTFFLMPDGEIVEVRLPDYSARQYKTFQKQRWKKWQKEKKADS